MRSAKVFSEILLIFWVFLFFLYLPDLLAGTYPSLVLSSFKPVIVLKGRFSSGTKGMILRKGLVVFQFAISIILIVGTLVVYAAIELYAETGPWVRQRPDDGDLYKF